MRAGAATMLWLASGGCAAVTAALHPVRADTAREVPGLGAALDPDAYAIEARSDEASQLSRRNNLVISATIGDARADRIEILARLASTEASNVDPRGFYIELDVDGTRLDVDRIELGPITEQPFDYTIHYPIQVQAGMIVLPSGETARTYTTEQRREPRAEGYYLRSAKLSFRHAGIVSATTHSISLQLNDLGVDMRLTWNLHPETRS